MAGKADQNRQGRDGAEAADGKQQQAGNVVDADPVVLVMGLGIGVVVGVAGIQAQNDVIVVVVVQVVHFQFGGDVAGDML